jgi:hypothetical protein
MLTRISGRYARYPLRARLGCSHGGARSRSRWAVAFQASSSRTPLIGRWAGGAGLGSASRQCGSAPVPGVIAAAAMHGAIDGHAMGPREERGTFRPIQIERTVKTLWALPGKLRSEVSEQSGITLLARVGSSCARYRLNKSVQPLGVCATCLATPNA